MTFSGMSSTHNTTGSISRSTFSLSLHVLCVPQSMLDAQGAEARGNLCVCVCMYVSMYMCICVVYTHAYVHVCSRCTPVHAGCPRR